MFRFCCVMFGASSFPRAVFQDLFFALRGLCSDFVSHALRPTRATCLSSPDATRGGRSPLQIVNKTYSGALEIGGEATLGFFSPIGGYGRRGS